MIRRRRTSMTPEILESALRTGLGRKLEIEVMPTLK